MNDQLCIICKKPVEDTDRRLIAAGVLCVEDFRKYIRSPLPFPEYIRAEMRRFAINVWDTENNEK